MRHAHFMEMGGFALCFPEDKVRAELRHEKREVKAKNNNDEVAMKNDENAQGSECAQRGADPASYQGRQR
jgi:hypothetical protein